MKFPRPLRFNQSYDFFFLMLFEFIFLFIVIWYIFVFFIREKFFVILTTKK